MSDLLNQASLVMVPSGYKEDTVYSVVPSDGSGDLAFTRASNGTRINSAGLVEVVPWNLVQYSEDFSNANWYKSNGVITANDTTAPNGTTTADKFGANGTLTSSYFFTSQYVGDAIIGQPYTATLYAKAGTLTQMMMYLGAQNGIYWNLSNGQFISYYNGVQNITAYNSESVGNGWYKYTISINASNTSIPLESYSAKSGNITGNYTTADNYYLWGAQLNIGSTAKPYFPTTDRLNVPRLTYQNGGGGCPSLLLEKQSTNLQTYSEDFTQWTASNATVTANNTTSPDGTQNADRVQFTAAGYLLGTSQSSGNVWTLSCWAKRNGSGTQSVGFFKDGSGVVDSAWALTSDWQRFTYTYTASNGSYSGIAGVNGGDVFVWGAQFEQSSYATSYIPTTSSSATRVADACFKTGISSLIGQSEGVLFADFVYLGETQSEVIDISDGTENNRVMLYINAVSQFMVFVTTSGTTFGLISTSYVPSVGSRYKVAIAYKSNDIAFYVNGTSQGTDTSATIPATSKLTISNGGASNYLLASQFNEAVLFKTRLTNAELASITTI